MRNKYLTKVLLGLVACVWSISAQPIHLEIKDVNTSAIPRVSLKTALTQGGSTVNQTNGVTYTVRENGNPVDFDITCPEGYNSIALVVHPSCLFYHPWSTSTTDSLPLAIQTFIDQLGVDDEVEIVLTDTAKTGGFIRTGYTSDKFQLKQFASSIEPVERYNINTKSNLNTRLMEAASNAVDRLIHRGGRRICLIISGDDTSPNWWSLTLVGPSGLYPDIQQQYAMKLLDSCASNQIPIESISWNSVGSSINFDRRLIRLSYETGGKFVQLHKVVNDSLCRVCESIAASYQEPYCTVMYEGSTCEDSIRHIEIDAEKNSEIASADRLVVSPWRPDTLRFVVDTDVLDVIPPEKFLVSFRLQPRIDSKLLTSFSFLLKYNPEAFRWLPPIQRGEMMEEVPITPKPVRAGVLKFENTHLLPSSNTGDLIVGTFEALSSAGSRPAIITLDSVEITAGCPNTVIVHPDTVYVCRCTYGLPFDVNATPVVTGDEVTLPVMVPDTLLFGQKPISGDAHYTLSMYFDSSSLSPTSVEGVATVSENATINWKVVNGDTLRVWTSEPFPSMPGNVLFNAHFAVKRGKSPVYSSIGVPAMRLFTDCCFTQSDSLPNSILIDGLCDKVVRRRADFTLEPNAPNPARGETSFRFTVHENERFSEAPATLTLYRSDGTVVGELYNNTVRAGEHLVPYNTSGLPAGTYYYTLTISGRMQTRSLVVVK